MTDLAPAVERHSEDKIVPAVVYGLYLLGFSNGLTFFIGLIVAYVQRGQAGPINESHYPFAIRTFWLSIAWFLVGGALVLFGIPLSLVLIGVMLARVREANRKLKANQSLLRTQSERDPLTGLSNRRHFLSVMEQQARTARAATGD